MLPVEIKGRRIIEGEPAYVVLEAGSNWLDLKYANDPEYGLRQAKKMIEAAHEAGADAVKFQIFSAKNHVSSKAGTPEYLKKMTSKSLFKIIQELELPRHWVPDLAAHAEKCRIDFFASPCDREAVEQLCRETDPGAFKVASFDIVDLDFLKYLAGKGRPIILSTGMASPDEIKEAVKAVEGEGNRQIILLHCISSYPTPIEKISLRSIQTLKDLTPYPVGFSDHTRETWTPSVAVALGACVIEKHFTLDRNQEGPDHPFALIPEEAREMIDRIRSVERALGRGSLGVRECEEPLHRSIRRCLVVGDDGIRAGEAFQRAHFTVKRGDGILLRDLPEVVGKRAKRDFQPDEILRKEDL